MQHFCGYMEIPSWSSAVLSLISPVPVPFPLGHTHLWKAMVQGMRVSHCPSDLMPPHRWLTFASPHIIWNWSQVPASLWLVHLLLYPLLIKSASFPSLHCARCSHSLQACIYSRTKGHCGIFWIRHKYAFSWMLLSPWRYLSLPITFVHFALWLRVVGKKILWGEMKINWNSLQIFL